MIGWLIDFNGISTRLGLFYSHSSRTFIIRWYLDFCCFIRVFCTQSRKRRIFKQIYLPNWWNANRYYHFIMKQWAWWSWLFKSLFTLSKAFKLEPEHQMQFRGLSRTPSMWGSYPTAGGYSQRILNPADRTEFIEEFWTNFTDLANSG